MAKHEVVNEILEYLDTRQLELQKEMTSAESSGGSDYDYLQGLYEAYTHMIGKLEDDFR